MRFRDQIYGEKMKQYLALIGVLIAKVVFVAQVNADVELNDGTILSDKPSWMVTYIEVDFDRVDEAKELLKKQMNLGKQQQGNLRFEVVQRISRDNHFVILEAWEDLGARTEYTKSRQTLSYRQALQSMQSAPYNERYHVGLETSNIQNVPSGNKNTIYVITHADFIPHQQFAPCERAVDAQGPCGNDIMIDIAKKGRVHDGNLRFDILTQATAPNHMTVVEMWQDQSAQTAHQSHQEKKNFRNQLAGATAQSDENQEPRLLPNMLMGSLWDERLYKLFD